MNRARNDEATAPEALITLVKDACKCFETVPDVLTTHFEDTGEDGWAVSIFPAPTLEKDGEKVFPVATIHVSDILSLFDGGKPEVVLVDDVLRISGTKEGIDVELHLMQCAPDDEPAATRILPGEGLSWEYISPQEQLDAMRPSLPPN